MQVMAWNTRLRRDILVKSDRLFMTYALELRIPFLAKQLTNHEKINKNKHQSYFVRRLKISFYFIFIKPLKKHIPNSLNMNFITRLNRSYVLQVVNI